jgi:hypothetical protein
MAKEPKSELSGDEATRRARDALRRALNTPHKPQQPTKDDGNSPAPKRKVEKMRRRVG